MATVERETQTDFDRWLEARRTFVGASESPAILGEGYAGENAWTCWARKTGILPEDQSEAREALEWGLEIQPVALRMFTRRTGIEVEDLGPYATQRHPQFSFIGATLDGLARTADGLAVVEAKNVGQYNAAEWADDAVPLRVQIQISHQMLAAGAQLGYAVACIGGNRLVWRRVERNDRFIAALAEQLKTFWALVESKTPPVVDSTIACAQVLAKLHKDDNGQAVELAEESTEWAERLELARREIKRSEKIEQHCKNLFADALGANTFGILPGGDTYSLKSQTRLEHVVHESTFRVLRKLSKPIRR